MQLTHAPRKLRLRTAFGRDTSACRHCWGREPDRRKARPGGERSGPPGGAGGVARSAEEGRAPPFPRGFPRAPARDFLVFCYALSATRDLFIPWLLFMSAQRDHFFYPRVPRAPEKIVGLYLFTLFTVYLEPDKRHVIPVKYNFIPDKCQVVILTNATLYPDKYHVLS
jgi:hypothetical protein